MEFPKGDAGDLQFGLWMKKHLKGARNVPLMLQKAHAYEVFASKQWVRFGGWQGVSFLLALSRADRSKVIGVLGADTHHYSTIRKRALQVGVVAARKARDTRSQSEQRVHTLRMFLVKLYKKRNDLPPIPNDVKQAMTPTVLSMIPADARA